MNSFDSSDITKTMNKGKGSLQPVGKHQDAVLTARRSEFRLRLQAELARIEKERQVSFRRIPVGNLCSDSRHKLRCLLTRAPPCPPRSLHVFASAHGSL